MATREFNFIVGPETGTLPTVTAPTGDGDLINLGWFQEHGMTRDAIIVGVADVAACKAIGASVRQDKTLLYIRSTNKVYSFNSGSSATGNDVSIITPTAGTGRWISTTGGGGGGSSILWDIPTDGAAPVDVVENGTRTLQFDSEFSQYCYTTFKVPSSFDTGTQIKLYLNAYTTTGDASKNIKLRCTSTLIRVGTDAITSTTNQNVSSVEHAADAAANKPIEFLMEVTDSAGQINGVSVTNAGHIIIVKLERVAASSNDDTADTRVIYNACELKTSS